MDQRKYQKKWREKHPHYQRDWKQKNPHYNRDWIRRHPEARKKQAEYYESWYAKNKRKRAIDYQVKIDEWIRKHITARRAMRLLNYALKTYRIEKPERCELCDRIKKLNGHHRNYNNPYMVIWVCHSCHKKIHYRRNFLRGGIRNRNS